MKNRCELLEAKWNVFGNGMRIGIFYYGCNRLFSTIAWRSTAIHSYVVLTKIFAAEDFIQLAIGRNYMFLTKVDRQLNGYK